MRVPRCARWLGALAVLALLPPIARAQCPEPETAATEEEAGAPPDAEVEGAAEEPAQAAAEPAPLDVEEALGRARAALDGFDYDGAAQLLEDVLAAEPSPEQELRARFLLVEAFASRGDGERAAAEASALYARDPGYPLPEAQRLPPRIRDLYVAAREGAAREPGALDVDALTVEGRLRLTLRAPEMEALVGRVRLEILSARGEWAEHPVRATEGRWVADLDVADEVRLVAEALSPHDHLVARAGTRDSPVTWQNPQPRPLDPIPTDGDDTAEVVGWILGGAALAGVAATLITLLVLEPWSANATLDDRIAVP